MKRILSVIGIFGLAVLFISAISIRETPQDPPRGKKTKHIKMVKIDDNGKKTELDTIIESDNVFIWNGDTIGGKHKMKWISEDDSEMDFDIDIEEGADGRIIIMKVGKGGIPLPPEMMMMKMHDRGNVIDLSDPGIISYEKKDLKDGKEKITIIRKIPTEKDMEMEEIFMNGGSAHPMMIHSGHPGHLNHSAHSGHPNKTIKVISTDDGNIEIIENGKVRHVKMNGENVRIIEEDGKIIRIKEIEESDGKTIKVKVIEKEIEKEKK